jgi:hypothetical protein
MWLLKVGENGRQLKLGMVDCFVVIDAPWLRGIEIPIILIGRIVSRFL